MPLFEKVGVRAQLTVTIREAVDRIYNPGELYEFDAARGERMLETGLDIFSRFNHAADGRITVLFGPQGPDFVSRDLLLRIQALARERKSKIHMHTSTQAQRGYGGGVRTWKEGAEGSGENHT